MKSLIVVLPHTLLMVGMYSLFLYYQTKETLIIYSILLVALFVLSLLFSENIYTFIFNILSAHFSPVLFDKDIGSEKKDNKDSQEHSGETQDSQDSQVSQDSQDSQKSQDSLETQINRYRSMSRQFYGLNKIITTLVLIWFLTHIFVNPQEQKYDAGTMYHQENFSTDFDCKIQCEKITFTMFMEHTLQIFLSSNVSSWGLMPPSNQSCFCACETQRIQSSDLGCNKICENITTSDDFIHLKEKGCNYHLFWN